MNKTTAALVAFAGAVVALVWWVMSKARLAPAAPNDLWVIQSKTGEPSLDRLVPLIVSGIRKHFGSKATLEIVRAAVAILQNESRGLSKYYLGDISAPGGPSIGPMQVYRATAIDLKLWNPPAGIVKGSDADKAAYAALATDEELGVDWAMAVLADKFRIAGGDLKLAVRLYNGSGPKAEAYLQKAIAYAGQKWPGTLA